MNNKDDFVVNYIEKLALPLLGLSEEDISFAIKNLMFESGDPFFVEQHQKKFNYVYIISEKEIYLDLEEARGQVGNWIRIIFANSLNDDTILLLCYLLSSFFNYYKDSTSVLFENALINEKINELILQKGLFSYALKDETFKNDWIDDLYKCLQNWSEKTYEGHNVCFGFLINPRSNGKIKDLDDLKIGKFVDFISEEYSAVFTDGITSIVEIDKECNFVKYHSTLHQKDLLNDNLNGVELPIRFAQIIYENVIHDKVGVFLLINGDMIIAQNRKISFVRRSGRWLNFSGKAFYDTISSYINNKTINKIIPSIYCSCLDVSFAHSGGLIAVVDENNEEWKNDIGDYRKPIVSKFDLLSDCDFDNFPKSIISISNKEKEKISLDCEGEKESIINGLKKDLEKKITKRRYLLQILKNERMFQEIDRKLRADLSGLDGAIILNTEGKIIACGAIIANKAGSSGGGRGSAARTLSKYGGFAIKISTDGYIEAFVNESRIYSIK